MNIIMNCVMNMIIIIISFYYAYHYYDLFILMFLIINIIITTIWNYVLVLHVINNNKNKYKVVNYRINIPQSYAIRVCKMGVLNP